MVAKEEKEMRCKLFKKEVTAVFIAQNCLYCPIGIEECPEQEEHYEMERPSGMEQDFLLDCDDCERVICDGNPSSCDR